MSDPTTDQHDGMDCARVMRDEITERYVSGNLAEPDREAFEQHYFECHRCSSELQAYLQVQAELERSASAMPHGHVEAKRSRAAWWIGVAAAVLVVATVALWPDAGVPEPPPVALAPAMPPAPPAAVPEPPVPVMTLAELSAVEPPVYQPMTLRSAPDPATRAFRQAMESYQRGDFAGAIPGLQESVALDDQQPRTRFFLGVCHLLTGSVEQAIQALQAVVALGETAYLEEARFHLAKAFLRSGDLEAARAELRATVALQGDRLVEAQRLLEELDKLR